MTKGQKAYREFLKTDFWKSLASEKKRKVGKCEECGSVEGLQAHHVTYPKDWFDSTLEHLKVLCRKHHMNEHGLLYREYKVVGRIFPYREDERYNRFMHYTDYLRRRIICIGIHLKPREVRYLHAALAAYPPKERDSCMNYHVTRTFEEDKIWIQ